jgi:hypothetical protein
MLGEDSGFGISFVLDTSYLSSMMLKGVYDFCPPIYQIVMHDISRLSVHALNECGMSTGRNFQIR